jgi:phosphatidylserine decarboxylase
MRISTILNRSFAAFIWNPMPRFVQILISRIYGKFYVTRVSRLIIPWFCRRYKMSPQAMAAYKPASDKTYYRSFQDFFSRQMAVKPKLSIENIVWPCQGNIVEFGNVKAMNLVNVKGQKRAVAEIFGKVGSKITDSFFVNIFLHNHHYHRIHSPVSGRVASIEHIPGKLAFLRPWFYKRSEVSKPSLVNERVILEIKDAKDKSWYLAIVGGMGVGTIILNGAIDIDLLLNCGDEIGHFLLGSTLCLALPYGLASLKYMKSVMAIDQLQLESLDTIDRKILEAGQKCPEAFV